jgi:hypothetical protein
MLGFKNNSFIFRDSDHDHNHEDHDEQQQQQRHRHPYDVDVDDQQSPLPPVCCVGGGGGKPSLRIGGIIVGLGGIEGGGYDHDYNQSRDGAFVQILNHQQALSSSSNRNDLFVPILHADDSNNNNSKIVASTEEKDQVVDDKEREEGPENDENDGDDDDFDPDNTPHSQAKNDDEFDNCSFIYEIDPARYASTSVDNMKDGDDFSEVTMMLSSRQHPLSSFGGRNTSKTNIAKRIVQQVVPFRGMITRRLSRWKSSRHPTTPPSSSSLSSSSLLSSASKKKKGLEDGRRFSASSDDSNNNNNDSTQSSSSSSSPSCAILLIDAKGRQFEIVEAAYQPNLSSCDDLLELPSKRSNSKSYRIRFQQYVGLALLHLCTDEDGNMDVLDLNTTFHPGQILPSLVDSTSSSSRHPRNINHGFKQLHQQQNEGAGPAAGVSSSSSTPFRTMSWLSSISSSSLQFGQLKRTESSGGKSDSNAAVVMTSPTSCPQTPTTVGTTIVVTDDENNNGNNNINICRPSPLVIPLLVAIPDQLPESETKELAHNLLSFPQVVSTLKDLSSSSFSSSTPRRTSTTTATN